MIIKSLITARGGSKSVPKKNIITLLLEINWRFYLIEKGDMMNNILDVQFIIKVYLHILKKI